MEKNIAIIVPGQGEEAVIHDLRIKSGTTVRETIKALGIENPQDFVLELEDKGEYSTLHGNENLYERVGDGQKLSLVPDKVVVAA